MLSSICRHITVCVRVCQCLCVFVCVCLCVPHLSTSGAMNSVVPPGHVRSTSERASFRNPKSPACRHTYTHTHMTGNTSPSLCIPRTLHCGLLNCGKAGARYLVCVLCVCVCVCVVCVCVCAIIRTHQGCATTDERIVLFDVVMGQTHAVQLVYRRTQVNQIPEVTLAGPVSLLTAAASTKQHTAHVRSIAAICPLQAGHAGCLYGCDRTVCMHA